MKILYILDQRIETGKTSGIIHKIRDKVRFWSKNGYEVEVLSLYDFRRYDSKLDLIDESKAFNIESHGRYFTLFRLFYSTFILLSFLKDKEYDLIYMRQRLYMPFTRRVLKKFRVIIEINTDDVSEWKVVNKLVYYYNLFTRDRFYSLASGFLSVSHELAKKFTKYNQEVFVIGNGTNTSKLEFVEEIKNDRPQICFAGSPGFPWHGIDKIEYLASECPEFDFHIVGEEGISHSNIKYYGYKSFSELQEIVKKCDVSVSTLSLHTKEMEEASPLKSRQYLAHGVPIIYAYDDTDLNGDEEFSLKIPNTPDNIQKNIQKIKDFVVKCHGNSELRKQARKFAEEKLDITIKDKVRIEFIKKIATQFRIIYLLDQNIEEGKTSGIIYKVRDQIRHWEKQGARVQLLSLYAFKLYDTELKLLDDRDSYNIQKHNSLITLFRLFYSTIKLLIHLPDQRFDMVYMRTRPYMPFTCAALKKYRVMMELNTNDIEEWKSLNKLMHIYNMITRKWFYNLAMGFVAVGTEIRDLYKPFGKPIEVIGNAIKVSDYKLIEETGNARPRVCFVGSPGFPWHGIDKIRYLASKLKDVDFIFIGESGEDYENVTFHGYCTLDRVTELLHTCDVAIGTMSLHEKGMNSTSTIKTRQYLAQGLPIFYGYRETDFSGEEEFLLELPNTPDNVEKNVERIHEFILHCFQNKQLRLKCREFAEEYLDVSVKEKRRYEFIQKVYQDSQI